MFGFLGILVAFGAALVFSAVKVLNEYERGVVLTLGRYTGTKGPGIIFLVPIVQRMRASLDALMDLARGVGDEDLTRFHPRSYEERVDGRTMAELGGEPILHMRAFGKTHHLPPELTRDVATRHARREAQAAR